MTSDIAVHEGGQLDAYRPQIMTPDAARQLDEQAREACEQIGKKVAEACKVTIMHGQPAR